MAQQNSLSPGAASLSRSFTDAFAFSFEVHRTQTKKGTAVPYISHLLEVSGLVLCYGGNEDEAIAALLHDAVEDHPDKASFATIGKRFGTRVAAIVESCSDTSVHPKPPWRGRKEKYIAHLRDADESVLMVAAADKLANIRAVLKDYRTDGDNVWNRFNAPKPEQLWYYRTVTQTIGDKAQGTRVQPLAEELARALRELEAVCGA